MSLTLDRDFALSASTEDVSKKAHALVFEIMRGYEDEEGRLPLHWRAVYSARGLEGEMLVSGLEEALVHHWDYYDLMEADLRLIGATTLANLYAEARAIFQRSGEEWLADEDKEEFRAVEKRMSAEHKRKKLSEYAGEFIKTHPGLFSE